MAAAVSRMRPSTKLLEAAPKPSSPVTAAGYSRRADRPGCGARRMAAAATRWIVPTTADVGSVLGAPNATKTKMKAETAAAVAAPTMRARRRVACLVYLDGGRAGRSGASG